MARKGPVTTDTTGITLGLAQIRVGISATHIANTQPALAAADSLGAMANTKFTGNTDWYKMESGTPLIEDFTTPIREAAMMECAFHEISPANLAIALGHDPTEAEAFYTDAHSGEVPLGGRAAPDYVRFEAHYTFPKGSDYMDIIFPRAQVTASVEIDFASEDAAAVPLVFESKNASSDVDGGNVVWDDKPLGRIYFSAD